MYTHITKQHGRVEHAVKGFAYSRNIARYDDDNDGATLRRSNDILALKVGLLRMLKSLGCAPAKCAPQRYMHGPIVLRVCV